MASLSRSTSSRCASRDSAAASCRAATSWSLLARSRIRIASASAARPVQPTASVLATSRSAILRISIPCSRSWVARLRITSVSPYIDEAPSSEIAGCVGDRIPRFDRVKRVSGPADDLEHLARDGAPWAVAGGQESGVVQARELLLHGGVGGRVRRGGAVQVVPVVVVADDARRPAVVGEGHGGLL